MNRKGVSFMFGALIGIVMLAFILTLFFIFTGGETREANTALSLLKGDTTKSCDIIASEAQSDIDNADKKSKTYIYSSLELNRDDCKETASGDSGFFGDVQYFPSQELPSEGLFCCLYASTNEVAK